MISNPNSLIVHLYLYECLLRLTIIILFNRKQYNFTYACKFAEHVPRRNADVSSPLIRDECSDDGEDTHDARSNNGCENNGFPVNSQPEDKTSDLFDYLLLSGLLYYQPICRNDLIKPIP